MSFAKKTVQHLDCVGKRVLVRVDFNVPTSHGEVTDDTRIVAAIPTIRYLLQKGARVVLASHLGRPKGGHESKYSMKPVKTRLERLLRMDVAWANDCVGEAAEAASHALKDGHVLLLENLRFHVEEEKNVPAFAEALARLGDCYVNDAFGTAHRAHASTEGVTKYLRPAVAGFLMQKELDYLGKALDQPARPFVAVLGGSKISGKIDVITALLGKVDRLLIGGAMMFTFNKALGLATGRSLVEDDRVEMARLVLEQAKAVGVEPGPAGGLHRVQRSGRQRARHAPQRERARAGRDGRGHRARVREAVRGSAGRREDRRVERAHGDLRSRSVRRGYHGAGEGHCGTQGARRRHRRGGRGLGRSCAAERPGRSLQPPVHGGGASLEFLEGKALPGVAALDNEGA